MAGNANSGRRAEKPFRDALRIECLAAERGDACDALPGSLRWNARQLLTKGDTASIKELADRLDGKAMQAVDLAVNRKRLTEMTDEELMAIASGEIVIDTADDPGGLH